MSLPGKLALVTGGSGIVGGGIVRLFMQMGAIVVAPLRSEACRAGLDSALQGTQYNPSSLLTPLADWGEEAGARQLAQYLRTETGRPIDHVVSISGGMASCPKGTPSTLDADLLTGAVHGRVTGHLLLAKHMLPIVNKDPGSSYTIISGLVSGPKGEVNVPAEYTLAAVANCALYALVDCIRAEQRRAAYRVNELRVGPAIRRDAEEQNAGLPEMQAFPASRLAAIALRIATGQQRDEVVEVHAQDMA